MFLTNAVIVLVITRRHLDYRLGGILRIVANTHEVLLAFAARLV